tara:strand:+ start:2476 stop:2862 length:387 start_codon:yes stop_codon:yes gene_type:complete
MVKFKEKSIMLIQENEEDNYEYKRNITNLNNRKVENYATQMNYRLMNGKGKMFYIVGIDDNGEIYGLYILDIVNSIKYLHKVSKRIGAQIENINCIYVNIMKKYILLVEIKSNNEKYHNPEFITFQKD